MKSLKCEICIGNCGRFGPNGCGGPHVDASNYNFRPQPQTVSLSKKLNNEDFFSIRFVKTKKVLI